MLETVQIGNGLAGEKRKETRGKEWLGAGERQSCELRMRLRLTRLAWLCVVPDLPIRCRRRLFAASLVVLGRLHCSD